MCDELSESAGPCRPAGPRREGRRGTSSRGFAFAVTLAGLLLGAPVRAQTLTVQESAVVRSLRRLHGFRPAGHQPLADGTPRRLYRSRRTGALLEFQGARDAPVQVYLLAPMTMEGAVTDTVLLLGVLHDGDEVVRVQEWLTSVLRDWADQPDVERAPQTRRFGSVDVRFEPLVAFSAMGLTIDAGRPFRDAQEAARGREEAERLRVRRVGELQAELRSLAQEVTLSTLLALRGRIEQDGALTEGDRGALLGELAVRSCARADAQLARAASEMDGRHLELAGLLLAEVSRIVDDPRTSRSAQCEGTRSSYATARGRLDGARLIAEREEQSSDGAREPTATPANVVGGAATARAARRRPHDRLSPGAALGLSLLPGGGQLYAGRPGAAVGFMLGTVAAVAGGVGLLGLANSRYDQYLGATTATQARDLYDGTSTYWTLSLVSFGVAAAVYVWNLIDAPVGAGDQNRERFGDE